MFRFSFACIDFSQIDIRVRQITTSFLAFVSRKLLTLKTMAKHHPDLIFCRKQPGVGKYDYDLPSLIMNYLMSGVHNAVSLYLY